MTARTSSAELHPQPIAIKRVRAGNLRRASVVAVVAMVIASCVASIRTGPTAPATAPAPPPVTRSEPPRAPDPCCRDTHEQLLGVLWMQTAVEYRMIAESTYRAAAAALAAALADPTWTAATEQAGDASALPPAVILDLDETVLDNSRVQGELALRRTAYSSTFWKQWVELEAAGLVPGAKAFLDRAREQGVAVFFLTNRSADEEAHTLANLRALGVAATPEHTLCLGENGWSSDKTPRRQFVAQTHRIVLLIGDDLGDFIPARLPLEKRAAAAAERSAWWGTRWFVLPNPLYGSWERALWNHESGLSDREQLLRRFAHVKGFTN